MHSCLVTKNMSVSQYNAIDLQMRILSDLNVLGSSHIDLCLPNAMRIRPLKILEWEPFRASAISLNIVNEAWLSKKRTEH